MSRIQYIDENYERKILYQNPILQKYPQTVPPLVIRGLIHSVTPASGTAQLNCFFMIPSVSVVLTIFDKTTRLSKGNFPITGLIGNPSNVINTYRRIQSVSVSGSLVGVNTGDVFEFTAVEGLVWISPPPDPFPTVYGVAIYDYNTTTLTANPIRSLTSIPALRLFYTFEGEPVFENNTYNITNVVETSLSDATCSIPALGFNITGSIFFWDTRAVLLD